MDKLHYKGWAIIPTALPTEDNQWRASCDLARITGAGEEVFEGATLSFVRANREEALNAACDEAVAQIENLIADPSVRLA